MTTLQKDILALKDRIDMVDLAGKYVDLRRIGKKYVGKCPFHADRTPSFHVDPAKGRYFCFGCGKSGDVISFVQDIEQVSFAEAVSRLGGGDLGSIEPPQEPRTLPADEPVFVDRRKLESSTKCVDQTSLYQFLCRLFPSGRVLEVCRQYMVGASRYVNHQGGRAASLPYINHQGQIVDVKLMHFHPRTGSRKDAPPLRRWADTVIDQTWFLAECQQSGLRAPWPCFGEHLLAEDTDKPIGVVESEKTALLASLAHPDHVWLAVGGKANLHRLPIQTIGHRRIELFPDRDAFEIWSQEAKELRRQEGCNISVNRTVQQQCTGEHDDLGDLIISQLGYVPPVTPAEAWTRMQEAYPDVKRLGQALNLTPVAVEQL